MPIQLKIIIFLCKFLSLFSATLAANFAYKIWTKTSHHPAPSRELKWQSQAQTVNIDFQGLPITVYEWGEGATILLIHGWSGRGTQMGAIALALAENGYKAIAIDLPSHGKTPGSQTNAFEMAKAIYCVTQHYGNIHGLVTHSFGVFPVSILLRQGLIVNRVICVNPPDNMLFLVNLFSRWLKLSDKIVKRLHKKIENLYGSDVWKKASPDSNVSNTAVPSLIIHDKNDREVPWQRGQSLAKQWPNSKFYLTHELGHLRILRNKTVIDKIVSQME